MTVRATPCRAATRSRRCGCGRGSRCCVGRLSATGGCMSATIASGHATAPRGSRTHRPQRRPRRGGHRRRRAAGGRHQRQRGVRLPRRQRRRSCARCARGGRGAGSRSAPRCRTTTGAGFGRVPRDVAVRRAARAGRRPGRDARRRSRRPPAPRCATSSRTARSTTGCSTTRSRRGRCSPAPGDLPVLGMPGRLLTLAARRRAGGASTRASPTAATRADGRLVPRSEPGALVDGRGRGSSPRRSRWPPTRRLAVPARRQPGRGRARASPYAGRSRRWLDCAGSERATVGRPA